MHIRNNLRDAHPVFTAQRPSSKIPEVPDIDDNQMKERRRGGSEGNDAGPQNGVNGGRDGGGDATTEILLPKRSNHDEPTAH